jgi:FlaA1/EpsC-like NDP-sugar epimerase
MFESVHEIAILVSALLAVALGSVWYSPMLFGKIQIRALVGMHQKDIFSEKEMLGALIKGVCAYVVFFFILTYMAQKVLPVLSFNEYVALIFVLIGTVRIHTVIWKTQTFGWYMITMGYWAIVIYGGLGISIFWPW